MNVGSEVLLCFTVSGDGWTLCSSSESHSDSDAMVDIMCNSSMGR